MTLQSMCWKFLRAVFSYQKTFSEFSLPSETDLARNTSESKDL